MPLLIYHVFSQCQTESCKNVTNLSKFVSQDACDDELAARFEAGADFLGMGGEQIGGEVGADDVPLAAALGGQAGEVVEAGPDAVADAV